MLLLPPLDARSDRSLHRIRSDEGDEAENEEERERELDLMRSDRIGRRTVTSRVHSPVFSMSSLSLSSSSLMLMLSLSAAAILLTDCSKWRLLLLHRVAGPKNCPSHSDGKHRFERRGRQEKTLARNNMNYGLSKHWADPLRLSAKRRCVVRRTLGWIV